MTEKILISIGFIIGYILAGALQILLLKYMFKKEDEKELEQGK